MLLRIISSVCSMLTERCIQRPFRPLATQNTQSIQVREGVWCPPQQPQHRNTLGHLFLFRPKSLKVSRLPPWVKSAVPFNRRLPVNFRYAPFATGSRGAALCREGLLPDVLGVGSTSQKVPTPDIQKWITLDPEASIRRAVPSRFSAISLGAHGVSMAILQRCRTLNGKWSSFKRLSELIGDTTAQSGRR
jgi:hypothetical protein